MKVEVEATDLMAVLGPAVSYAEHEIKCDDREHREHAEFLQAACHRCARAVTKALLADPPPELAAMLRILGLELPDSDESEPVPPAGKAAKIPTDPRGDAPREVPVAKMTRDQLEVEADRLGVPNAHLMNIGNLREYVEAARHRKGHR